MRRKGTGQSSSTTIPETQSSGISKTPQLPKVLPYPQYLQFDKLENNVRNLFCYVVRHYGNNGLSVLIYRQPIKDQVVVICGDWNGNNLDITDGSDLSKIADKFIKESVATFIGTMRLIKVDQAQFFFAIVDEQLVLVDIQVAINKLTGPGMVRDIFGKIFPTQEILKIEVIDDRAIEYIRNGSGCYSGDLIIKPSRFRMYHDANANSFAPMYVEVVR